MGHKGAVEESSDTLRHGDDVEREKTGLSPARFLGIFVGVAVLMLGLSWFLLDETLSAMINDWLASPNLDASSYSFFAIALLASDLLLPVPSSAVITHAGIFLGSIGGAFVGFLGLTMGSLVGFGLVRFFGRGWIENKINERDLVTLNRLTDRYGVYIVVILRPIPILAEASVLLLAAGQMSWKPFLFWLSISNLFVAIFFSAFGQWAKENEIGEMTALFIGIAIPILLLVGIRFLSAKHLSQLQLKN